jgi:hypothetical protein
MCKQSYCICIMQQQSSLLYQQQNKIQSIFDYSHYILRSDSVNNFESIKHTTHQLI